MRKKIVAGNWKMNKNLQEAEQLFKEITEIDFSSDVKLVVCPPAIYLNKLVDMRNGTTPFIGAQNCHFEKSGAYTGEVSADMLNHMGVEYCILGHSERREYFHETDEVIETKVKAVLSSGMIPIFCCGEKLEERESGNYFKVVETQVKQGLFSLDQENILKVVIAYEPVWAIGTGLTAAPDQAQEIHEFIRKLLADQYNQEIADQISILYGGSCKPDNANELFSCADIDGGLIGGAALNAESFLAIAKSF